MARRGTGEQCANSLNGLAAATNDAADVSSSKLQLKDGCSAARNFREYHVVRKFDQLPNDELEKFFHVASGVGADASGEVTGAGVGSARVGGAAADEGTSCFLFFLIKLRTVSEG